MRGTLRKLLAAIAVVMTFAPAHAQMRHRGMPESRDAERNLSTSQAESQRGFAPRQEFVPPGRMTPDERRQLRRDIHEAGRELYRRDPPSPPPGSRD